MQAIIIRLVLFTPIIFLDGLKFFKAIAMTLNHRHKCASCASITRKACLSNRPTVLMCSEKTIPPLYIERTTGSLRKVPITLMREKFYSPLLYRKFM
jgi:hypothetical protein